MDPAISSSPLSQSLPLRTSTANNTGTHARARVNWNWQKHLDPNAQVFNTDQSPANRLVQRALEVWEHGNLTETQCSTISNVLWDAIQRMLHEDGCGNIFPFTFQGETKELDALQLLQLLMDARSNGQGFTPTNAQQAWNKLKKGGGVSPEVICRGLHNRLDSKNNIPANTRPLSPAEQAMAKAVIAELPPYIQGNAGNLDAVLIGRQTFMDIMNEAATQPGFPPILAKFREAAKYCPGIRLALKSQPSVAYGLLFPGKAIPPATLPSDYSAQVTHEVVPPGSAAWANRLPWALGGESCWNKLLSHTFGKLQGFGAQNAVNVPSCFDMPCPTHSVVKANGQAAGVHANVLSVNGPGQLIAAMQPVVKPAQGLVKMEDLENQDRENVASFLSMAITQSNPEIVDLRSEHDIAKGKAFEYCPQQLGQTFRFDNVSITTTGIQQLNADTKQLTVQIQEGSNPPVEMPVLQFRGWPDHGVVNADTLRTLGQHVARRQQAGASVITHCRAGVGRTGTVLAYAKLHQKLIEENGAEHLFNRADSAKPDYQKVLEKVTEEVVQGRIQRGPLFVQEKAQFKLLANTVLEDVQKWKKNPPVSTSPAASPPPVSPTAQAASTPPASPTSQAASSPPASPISQAASSPPSSPTAQAASTSTAASYPWASHLCLRVPVVGQPAMETGLHANRVGLIPNHVFTIAQEPKTAEAKWQHLHSLFHRGCDSIEFISDPRRSAGGSQQPKEQGLNILSPVLLDAFNYPDQYGGKPEIHIGNFRIDRVSLVRNRTKNGCTVKVFQFDVTDQATGQTKFIRQAQMFSEFKNNMLNRNQLTTLIELSNFSQLNHADMWLSSAAGIGRPSAWLMARHISHAVQTGQLTLANHQQVIDHWINAGRQQRSPHFIHSTAQRAELIALARDLLTSKVGASMPDQAPPRGRRPERSSRFGDRISSFLNLLDWGHRQQPRNRQAA